MTLYRAQKASFCNTICLINNKKFKILPTSSAPRKTAVYDTNIQTVTLVKSGSVDMWIRGLESRVGLALGLEVRKKLTTV